MNTKEIRKEYGMTQEQFAEKFRIPLGTVRNWDSRNCMPYYVNLLITYYFRAEEKINDLENVVSALTDLM